VNVLVACEYSGRVREAFRALGHNAWSCDLLEAEDGSRFHIRGDAMKVAYLGGHHMGDSNLTSITYGHRSAWDLMVAHPPCTHLAVSGARHFEEKRADGRQQAAIDFFLALARVPIPRIPMGAEPSMKAEMTKYPNILTVASVIRSANEVLCGLPDGRWVPYRSEGFSSWRHRIRAAWLVFTGRADALIWEQQ
jgi:hypothetical protein